MSDWQNAFKRCVEKLDDAVDALEKEAAMSERLAQHTGWAQAAMTADLDELEHVLSCHIENEVPLEAVLRLDPETVARILLSLREQWHTSNEVDAADDEEAEARVAELERTERWLRYVLTTKLGHSAGSTQPPAGWNDPVRENNVPQAPLNP